MSYVSVGATQVDQALNTAQTVLTTAQDAQKDPTGTAIRVGAEAATNIFKKKKAPSKSKTTTAPVDSRFNFNIQPGTSTIAAGLKAPPPPPPKTGMSTPVIVAGAAALLLVGLKLAKVI